MLLARDWGKYTPWYTGGKERVSRETNQAKFHVKQAYVTLEPSAGHRYATRRRQRAVSITKL